MQQTTQADPRANASPLPVEAYTIPDFCRAYGVGRSFTYEEIKAGRLRIVKAGRRTLIPAASARKWFTRLGGEAA